VLDDRLEERTQVLAHHRWLAAREPLAGVRVEHGELDLLLGGVEVDEEVVDLVQHLLRAGVGTVDLVHDHDRRQPALERLPQDEPRLRERPFRGVHQQHHAVHHRQRPLDLPAEIGVARGVADIDEQVLVVNRRVLGQDRDAALALEVVAVHDTLGDLLVGAERPALAEERVDERRLAMVDVGDDRDVAPAAGSRSAAAFV